MENLKPMKDLKQGSCKMVVKTITGQIKELEASYSKKFKVVFCCYHDTDEVLGYLQ